MSGAIDTRRDRLHGRDAHIHEGEEINEPALKELIRAAVALNLKGQSKPKPKSKRASSKRAG